VNDEPLAGFTVGVTAARRREELSALLERRGARVVHAPAIRLPPAEDAGPLEVYRRPRADDPTPLRRLVGQVVAGTVDAITFTGAPAVGATLLVAAEGGLEAALLEALRTRVVAACVSAAVATPLEERGVGTVTPRRPRLGALAQALSVELPVRGAGRVTVDGHALELRGHAVVLDGRLRPIAPAPMAILRALARRPGHVVSRSELCGVLPGRALPGASYGRPRPDEHAVEMAVARLRRGLGRTGLVETVVKRGYRLACDPPAAESAPAG
jgi:uroporphyrinogen-III synthase